MLFAFEIGEAVAHLGPCASSILIFMIYFYLPNIIIIK